MKVSIIGLGLMGGSFALSIKKSFPEWTVFGYDHNKSHQEEAIRLNLVDNLVTFDEVKKSDIIVLAIPVEGIIKILQDLKDIDSKTTIIDLGSTKAKIIQNTPKEIRKNLVASHPMAGTENTGPTAAFDSLYQDKVVVLCDMDSSGEKQQKTAIEIFTKIGMKIVYMDSATEHDLHAAYISHLPHAISFALANSVLKQEDPKSILALAGGGFKSMSRIAKSSPVMWSDIFKQNKQNLLTTLDTFETELKYMRKLIEDEKWEELQKWMSEANLLHNIL